MYVRMYGEFKVGVNVRGRRSPNLLQTYIDRLEIHSGSPL